MSSALDKYSCGACPTAFRNKKERAAHRDRYHPEKRDRYKRSEGQCPVCKNIARAFFSFFDHFNKEHGKEYYALVHRASTRLGNDVKQRCAPLFFDLYLPKDGPDVDYPDTKSLFPLLDKAIARIEMERKGGVIKNRAEVEKENEWKEKERKRKEKEEREKREKERQEPKKTTSPADDGDDSDIEIVKVVKPSPQGIRKAKRAEKKEEPLKKIKEEEVEEAVEASLSDLATKKDTSSPTKAPATGGVHVNVHDEERTFTYVGEKSKRAGVENAAKSPARSQTSSSGRVGESDARLMQNNTTENVPASILSRGGQSSSLKRRSDEDAPPNKKRVSVNLDNNRKQLYDPRDPPMQRREVPNLEEMLSEGDRETANPPIPAPVSPIEATAAAAAGAEQAADPVGSQEQSAPVAPDAATVAAAVAALTPEKQALVAQSIYELNKNFNQLKNIMGIGSPVYEEAAAGMGGGMMGAAAGGPRTLEDLVAAQMAEAQAAADAAAAAIPPLAHGAEPCQREKDHWNGKGPAQCPRGCPLSRNKDTKQNRILHYKKCHYEIYYALAKKTMTALQQWLLQTFGDAKEGHRACLHCPLNRRLRAEHVSRKDLVLHIRETHQAQFWRHVAEYAEQDTEALCDGDIALHVLLSVTRPQ